MVYQGRFAETDEIFFKAAGAQWAETGRFAAPELSGFLGADPPVERIFAVYPPVYPFLFGVFVRLVGFGWRCCILYDALIHVSLALAVLLYATQFDSRFKRMPGVLLVALILPLGTAARPDELAMAFGIGSVCVAAFPRQSALTAIVSGVALGIAAGTSLGAGAVFSLLAVARILCERKAFRRGAFQLAGLSAASVVTMCVIWLPIVISEPSALGQFLLHLRGIRKLMSGPPAELWEFVWRYGHFQVIVVGVTLAIGLATLAPSRSEGRTSEWRRLWLGPLLGLVFVLVMVPKEYTYLWFVAPALIVASTVSLLRLFNSRPLAAFVGALFLLGAVAAGWTPFALARMEFVQLVEDQTYSVNQARVRTLVPSGATALVNPDAWWMLRGHCRVYSMLFARPDFDLIQVIVLSGNGSGAPGRVRVDGDYAKNEIQTQFTVLSDNLPRNPVTIGGNRVSSSAYGFGQKVLGRQSKEREKAPRAPALTMHAEGTVRTFQ